MKIGQKWRLYLALLKKIPVESPEPRVLSQVSYVLQPFFGFFLKQSLEQILQLRGPVFVEIRFPELDLFEEFAPVLGVEWRESMNEFIDERAKAPPVNCLSVAFFLDDLWSQVLWSSANRESIVFSYDVVLRQPEISDLDVPLLINQDVFRFETILNGKYSR